MQTELIELEKEQDLSEYSDYIYVDTPYQLEKAIEVLSKSKHYAIDTETTGLDPHTSNIRLVQIATINNPTYIIDLFHCDIKKLIPILHSEKIKIFQNAKFDIKFFLKYGIIVQNRIFDTMLASQLLSKATGKKTKNDLKSLAKLHIGIDLSKEERLSDWTIRELTDSQLKYAAIDAKILLNLYVKLGSTLCEYNLDKVAKIEFKCVLGCSMIEFNGMAVDYNSWLELLTKTQQEVIELEDKIQKLIPCKSILFPLQVNLNSPTQLKERLEEHNINLPNTSVDTLKQYEHKYPKLIGLILEYRKKNKILSSFGDKLLDKRNPKTHRLHPNIRQLGADTGRMSLSSPNLQQIPHSKEIRSLFIPSKKDNVLIICDYSQMELRIAAEYTNCQAMLEAYNNNQDLHRKTASLILNKPESEITKSERTIAKSAAFGLIYGSSVNGFIKYSRSTFGLEFTEKEAKHIISVFFKAYPELKKWHNKIKYGIDNRYFDYHEVTTLTGRIRYLADPRPQTVLNTPIQGTGADITKLALANLAQYIFLNHDKSSNDDFKIIACVHDEIVCECNKNTSSLYSQIVKDIMESSAQSILSLVKGTTEVEIGTTWADK